MITSRRVEIRLSTRLDAISNDSWRRRRSGIVQMSTITSDCNTSTVQNKVGDTFCRAIKCSLSMDQ